MNKYETIQSMDARDGTHVRQLRAEKRSAYFIGKESDVVGVRVHDYDYSKGIQATFYWPTRLYASPSFYKLDSQIYDDEETGLSSVSADFKNFDTIKIGPHKIICRDIVWGQGIFVVISKEPFNIEQVDPDQDMVDQLLSRQEASV